jgi:hypothetical protein
VKVGRVWIQPIFAWYDLWIGAYWDGARRVLYLLPLPCVGIRIDFRHPRIPL